MKHAGKSLIGLGVALLMGCSGSKASYFADPDAGSSGGSSSGGSSSGGSSSGGLLGGDGGSSGASGGSVDPACPPEAQFVYTVDQVGMLRRFDPPKVVFTPVGVMTCSGGAYSMAIDRNAFAWVVQPDGKVVKVDTRTAACSPTAFVSGQHGFASTFGMGFAANAPGSSAETLFLSSSTDPSLATLDTTTLALTKIAPYDALHARAEMTGTGDGRLYGAFEGTPYVVAEIDPTSAHIKSQAPQSAINYPPGSSNFAFAFWGGDFYLFVGPGTSTDVFRYRPSDSSTVKLTTVSFIVTGAGVSTCAPTTSPK